MSAINWFDIPVTDIKGCKFYSTILGAEVQMMDAPAKHSWRCCRWKGRASAAPDPDGGL